MLTLTCPFTIIRVVIPLPTRGTVPGIPDKSLYINKQWDTARAASRTGRGVKEFGGGKFKLQLCQADEEEAGGAEDGDDADGRARLHQLAAHLGGEAADERARADQQHRRLPRRLGDEAVRGCVRGNRAA